MKKWDKKEIIYLKENYQTKTNKEISNFLTRSNRAIIWMANKFGLRKGQLTICQAHRHKSFEITKSILEKKYLIEGKSIRKIAAELKLGKNTIDYYLNKHKISKRTTSEANKSFYAKGGKIWRTGLTKETDRRILFATQKMRKTWDEKRVEKLLDIENRFGIPIKEIINKLYWGNSLNQEEIAKRTGLARRDIIKLMRRFKISKRPNYQYISSLRGEEHSMYGTKWEQTYGVEKAKQLKAERSAWSRKNIIKRLENREMPFKETKIERKIMSELTKRNISFISQYEIDNKFVSDVAIPQYKIIIECDGDYWHANPKLYNKLNKIQKRKVQTDKFKDEYLKRKGWEVLRFFESDINKSPAKCIDLVEEQIRKVLNPLDSLNNPAQNS